MTRSQLCVLVLRVAVEVAIIAAFSYWGYERGHGTANRVILCLVAPAIGFGIWGGIDFHQAGRLAEPMRLVQELAISAAAAVALWLTGVPALALALAALSLLYHGAVYATGGRLLKPRTSMGRVSDVRLRGNRARGDIGR